MGRSPEVTSRLLWRLGTWDAVDSSFQARIPFDSPADHAALLERMVKTGEAKLWHLAEEGKRIGFMITRVDKCTAGDEFVLVAAVCFGSESFTREIAKATNHIAKESGCVSIRFHTCRPGLARIACDEFDYRLSELVLRKNA